MNRVIEAFRNCITEPKCKDCPWMECEEMNNRKIKIPADLALAVNNLLVEHEAVHPNKMFSDNGFRYDFCGNCGRLLPVAQDFEKAKYCPNCGKAVKWE